MNNLFEQYRQAIKLLDQIEEKILDAIGKVLEHKYGYTLNNGTYYYPGAIDGGIGHLRDAIIDDNWLNVVWSSAKSQYRDEEYIEVSVLDILDKLK